MGLFQHGEAYYNRLSAQWATSTWTQTHNTTPLLTQGIQMQAYYWKLLTCVTCKPQNHDLTLYRSSCRSSRNLPESSGMQENTHFKQASGQASGNLPVSSGNAEIMKNKKQASGQASGNLPEPSGYQQIQRILSCDGNPSQNRIKITQFQFL